MIDEKTRQTEVDLDINDVLGISPEKESKKGMFDDIQPDNSFFDKTPEDIKKEISEEEVVEDKKDANEINDKKVKDKETGEDKKPDEDEETIDDIVNAFNSENEEEGGKGRPKMNKDGLLDFTKKMIDKGRLIPFDDDKPIEEYSMKDFEELYEANEEEKRKKLEEEVPMKFFDAMPERLQYAMKYVADGGTDLPSLFKALAQTEEVTSLSPEKDAKTIVKNYLLSTNFGDEDEIEEEIMAWEDRGELESKAEKFKPKLDAMQEQILAKKLKEQEDRKIQIQKKTESYINGLTDTLSKDEINGIKLDKKTKSKLYDGLTAPKYSTSDGRQTNKLVHLLEKYQFTEPNHALLAEVMWLLDDPEGYKEKIASQGKIDEKKDTYRQLKTAEASKVKNEIKEEKATNKRPKLKRPNRGIFG